MITLPITYQAFHVCVFEANSATLSALLDDLSFMAKRYNVLGVKEHMIDIRTNFAIVCYKQDIPNLYEYINQSAFVEVKSSYDILNEKRQLQNFSDEDINWPDD